MFYSLTYEESIFSKFVSRPSSRPLAVVLASRRLFFCLLFNVLYLTENIYEALFVWSNFPQRSAKNSGPKMHLFNFSKGSTQQFKIESLIDWLFRLEWKSREYFSFLHGSRVFYLFMSLGIYESSGFSIYFSENLSSRDEGKGERGAGEKGVVRIEEAI